MRDVLVLCYHAISPTWRAMLSITPERLDAQLALLASRGYRGATFLDAVTAPPHERTVAITFDDSYRSVGELARPLLDLHGFPATVFVPTEYAGAEQPRGWQGTDHWLETEHAGELKPMSWDELAELAAAGWEIGSHTKSHPHLTELGDAELAAELGESKAECERRLGVPCRTLAYPYGDEDGRVVAATVEAGYEAAAALRSRGSRNPQRHVWPRVGVWVDTDMRRFRVKMSPAVRWLRATR
ncbi:MAG: polysaccharide deacetylase family protein [Solirubrobacterales bacterium]